MDWIKVNLILDHPRDEHAAFAGEKESWGGVYQSQFSWTVWTLLCLLLHFMLNALVSQNAADDRHERLSGVVYRARNIPAHVITGVGMFEVFVCVCIWQHIQFFVLHVWHFEEKNIRLMQAKHVMKTNSYVAFIISIFASPTFTLQKEQYYDRIGWEVKLFFCFCFLLGMICFSYLHVLSHWWCRIWAGIVFLFARTIICACTLKTRASFLACRDGCGGKTGYFTGSGKNSPTGCVNHVPVPPTTQPYAVPKPKPDDTCKNCSNVQRKFYK